MRCTVCSPGRGRKEDAFGQDTVLTPEDAVARVTAAIDRGDDVSGVLLWGPGEPLMNASTYVVLRHLQWLYPDLPVTVCTNGILLPERLEELVRTGVSRLIVSVSAVTADAAERLYESVSYRARQYAGRAAAELVLQQQWNGLENAVEAGLAVTAYVPSVAGVNDHETDDIRQRAEAVGAERVVVVKLLF
jgi:nitrogen fixation protein NifB